MYRVKIKVYESQEERLTTYDNFQEALLAAMSVSNLAQLIWTRHGSIDGSVKHKDSYYDIYDEGCISVEKE